MITKLPFPTLFLAGIWSFALGGCGDDSASPGSGGATGSGGAGAGGSSTVGNGGLALSGGQTSSGGAQPSGMGGSSGGSAGAPGAGGAVVSNGGLTAAGGAKATGGASSSGGGTSTGGTSSASGGAAGGGSAGMTGGKGGASGTGGGGNPGSCTASKATGSNASGSGKYQVVVETNSDAGIREGTIYRPKDLGGAEKYPILVWGNGACSKNGYSNSAAMAEIASHGYFVVSDGTPNGSGSRQMMAEDVVAMGKPLIAYIDWAIAENGKSCSAYHQSLDTTKIAANGFSCGGLMATGTAADPRITTWGITSSGSLGATSAFYASVHTPVLIILGGESDIAYPNGQGDYRNLSPKTNIPLMLFSKNINHGGDLGARNGGDFTKIHLSWLNWWTKNDTSATGKGRLVGAGCSYCTDSAWEVKSANLP